MAYTNETTHFGIPLPLGSDLTTPMDYNESMQDVDTALFEAQTDSGSALQKANQLQLDLSTTNDNLTGVAGRVTTLEGTATTQGQAIIQNAQDIADVRADALDMIVAKDEGTAQVATVAVTKGEYFRYNDVLYIATSDIAIGDTIVPNENCSATNVGTELSQLNSDLDDLQEFEVIGYNVIGTTHITIPSSYANGKYMIQIVSTVNIDNNAFRFVQNMTGDNLAQPSQNTFFRDGSYYSENTHSYCEWVLLTNGELYLNNFTVDASGNVASTAHTFVTARRILL